MNALKIALNYRLINSRTFSALLKNYVIRHKCEKFNADQLNLNAYNIGHLCSSKKQLSEYQKEVFSEILNIPKSFFDYEFDELYNVKSLKKLLCSYPNINSVNDKQELYLNAVASICLNNILKFVTDRFNIPKISNETKDVFKFIGNKLEFHKSDIYDEITVSNCVDKENGLSEIVSKTLEWLGCLNKIPNNLIRILETKGFVFFSFKSFGWYLNSFSVVLDDYVVIFLRDDLLPLSQNTVVFEELLQVIVSFVSNSSSIVNNCLKLKFASRCVFQDCLVDKINCDYFSYSKICFILNKLRCDPYSYLTRLNELKNFNRKLSYNEIKQISEDLNEFYYRVWSKNCLNEACELQYPLLWEKLKQFSFSYEYMSNVISLPPEDINTLCFNANADYSSTISLKIVND